VLPSHRRKGRARVQLVEAFVFFVAVVVVVDCIVLPRMVAFIVFSFTGET
jgi:hypothetical protein